jgi:transcription initiation factor TFIID TATA-box-binding protein
MGIKTIEDGKRAYEKLESLFQGHSTLAGLHLAHNCVQVKNLVATVSLGFALDLDSLSSNLEGANYDPTEFSGFIVKMNGSASATLYGNGKIIFTGVDTVKEMSEFVHILCEKVLSLSGANIAENEHT